MARRKKVGPSAGQVCRRKKIDPSGSQVGQVSLLAGGNVIQMCLVSIPCSLVCLLRMTAWRTSLVCLLGDCVGGGNWHPKPLGENS